MIELLLCGSGPGPAFWASGLVWQNPNMGAAQVTPPTIHTFGVTNVTAGGNAGNPFGMRVNAEGFVEAPKGFAD